MGTQKMERVSRLKAWVLVPLLLIGCTHKIMKIENPEVLKPSAEFERTVQIVVPEVSPPPAGSKAEIGAPGPSTKKAPEIPPPKKIRLKKEKLARKIPPAPVGPPIHEPVDVEDAVGFEGRRPLSDPFRVGEKVVHDVHYFAFSAGTLTMQVDPFAQVNGKKAYNFVTSIQTYPKFSSLVYAVDDKAVTLLDFDLLVPRVFSLHVKESGQLREGQSYFDHEKLEATYWEKKITEKGGVEEKKEKWEIAPFSQNVFSAIFYMRLFKWETGKEYAFRVADDEQNLVFKGTAVRRETLQTELGPMKAVVVSPQISTKGIFKPMGEILIWLSDDDRRLVLRIESKIKIGTLVSEVIRIEPGHD